MTLSALTNSILVIEDDGEIRETLSEILEYEGYEVHTVKNGQEGIEYLKKFPLPKLILLDFMMPVMNGWQFREIQKQDPELSKIPVVVLSADNKLQEKAYAVSANAFIKKPIELELLLKVIKNYF